MRQAMALYENRVSSEKMPLLQAMVHTQPALSRPAVLLKEALPAGEQSGEPPAVAGKTCELGSLARVGKRQARAGLAEGEPGLLEASQKGTLQDLIGVASKRLLFMENRSPCLSRVKRCKP